MISINSENSDLSMILLLSYQYDSYRDLIQPFLPPFYYLPYTLSGDGHRVSYIWMCKSKASYEIGCVYSAYSSMFCQLSVHICIMINWFCTGLKATEGLFWVLNSKQRWSKTFWCCVLLTFVTNLIFQGILIRYYSVETKSLTFLVPDTVLSVQNTSQKAL